MDTASIPSTMTAWSRSDYGSADGVQSVTTSVPVPRKDEVLVKIRATALNAGDVRLMLGNPLLVRLVFGLRRPKQPIRGMDVAGTVVTVGSGVSTDRLGDEVIAELNGGGGLARYAVVRVDRLAVCPAGLDPVVAATLPIAGGTAVQALDVAGVRKGHRVLVIGASGGVGTFAVQLAALRGAEVWATCGGPNRALIERLGATRTFDYRHTDLSTLPTTFDAIIDIAGAAPLRRLKRLLTPAGIVALVGGDGGHVLGPIPRMLRAVLLSIGARRRISPVAAVSNRDVNEKLVALAAEGRVTPVIERILPWSAAVDGLERLQSGRTVGKVVVRARS